jgi:hypothetical protein
LRSAEDHQEKMESDEDGDQRRHSQETEGGAPLQMSR